MSGRYVGYDTRAGRPIHEGDWVTIEDEWGYWRADPDAATGRVVWSRGWLTLLERADGVSMVADGHTTTLTLTQPSDNRDNMESETT